MKRRALFAGAGLFAAGLGLGHALQRDSYVNQALRKQTRKIREFLDPVPYDFSPGTRPDLNPITQGPFPFGFHTAKIDRTLRIGIVGAGVRGSVLARIVQMTGIGRIAAVSDIYGEQIDKLQNTLHASELDAEFARFEGSPEAWESMLGEDLDFLLIATPWKDHVPMALTAMKEGVHVGVEVPLCLTVEEAWEVFETAKATKRHCLMLENVCFAETEMTLLNLCRAGVLGRITHAQAAYLHDLRESHLNTDRHRPAHWRLAHHLNRNGNLYPTHGLGPVSKCLGVTETCMMKELVSMSGPSWGLKSYSGDENLSVTQGDMNVTLIRLDNGPVIELQFNTTCPMPYSRDNTLIGTNGIFKGFPDRLALEPMPHRYDERAWNIGREVYKPRIWQTIDSDQRRKLNFGHGGADFVMLSCIFRSLREGLPMPINLVESLTWSVIAPLSEKSVANRSQSVEIPDFSRGGWKQRGQVELSEDWAPTT